jgi:TonB family protein
MAPLTIGAITDQDDKTPDTVEAHIKKADEAYASKKFNLAKDEAKRALKLDEQTPAAHLILAHVYREQDKIEDAIKSAREAIKYRQNYPYAHYLLAILLYEQKKDFKQSADEIDLAISQGIRYISAFVLKGTLELMAARFETALQAYKKGQEMAGPNEPDLHLLKEQITALESYVDFLSHEKESAYTRPVPLNAPMPQYTEEARQKKVRGVVMTRILINELGEVTLILLVSRLGHGLDQEAIKAVSQIKFTPAKKDGKPVSYWLPVDIEFNIKGIS